MKPLKKFEFGAKFSVRYGKTELGVMPSFLLRGKPCECFPFLWLQRLQLLPQPLEERDTLKKSWREGKDFTEKKKKVIMGNGLR